MTLKTKNLYDPKTIFQFPHYFILYLQFNIIIDAICLERNNLYRTSSKYNWLKYGKVDDYEMKNNNTKGHKNIYDERESDVIGCVLISFAYHIYFTFDATVTIKARATRKQMRCTYVDMDWNMGG